MLPDISKPTAAAWCSFAKPSAGELGKKIALNPARHRFFPLADQALSGLSPALLILLYLYFKLVGVVEPRLLCGQAAFLLADQGLGVRTSV